MIVIFAMRGLLNDLEQIFALKFEFVATFVTLKALLMAIMATMASTFIHSCIRINFNHPLPQN